MRCRRLRHRRVRAMIVFTTVPCTAYQRIRAKGFDDALDSAVTKWWKFSSKWSGVAFNDEPLDDAWKRRSEFEPLAASGN